jgi:ATP-dependent exoDNAse (exonuclease V) alpha subunit
MSIFFARAKIISRRAGQSAVACAAYRSGEKIRDRIGETTHDYRQKRGIMDADITAPEGAPEWVRDRGELWNRVEEAENRKDAQLAREFVVAVPHELTPEERILTVREIARKLAKRGMVVDWSIHNPGRHGDERNVHAHLLTTMRKLEPDGFGKKVREWNDRGVMKDIKAEISEVFNAKLRARGLPEIDPRSYEEQGITDRQPQKHLGPQKTSIRRKEERLFREALDKEIAKIKANDSEVAEAMKADPMYKRLAVAKYLSGLSAADYATFASKMNEVLKNPKATAEQREYQKIYLELTKEIHPAVIQDSREKEAQRARERRERGGRDSGRS